MNAGDRGFVLALRGGRGFQQRISSMGLSVGCEVEITHGGAAGEEEGAVVVRTGETRLMLGHGMAEQIVVRSSSNGDGLGDRDGGEEH